MEGREKVKVKGRKKKIPRDEIWKWCHWTRIWFAEDWKIFDERRFFSCLLFIPFFLFFFFSLLFPSVPPFLSLSLFQWSWNREDKERRRVSSGKCTFQNFQFHLQRKKFICFVIDVQGKGIEIEWEFSFFLFLFSFSLWQEKKYEKIVIFPWNKNMMKTFSFYISLSFLPLSLPPLLHRETEISSLLVWNRKKKKWERKKKKKKEGEKISWLELSWNENTPKKCIYLKEEEHQITSEKEIEKKK